MTEEILSRLLTGEPVSGQTLSEELGVTRAAVWKQIGQLRELGFEIEACGGQGYRLVSVPDSLMAPVIARGLKTKWAGKRIIYLRSVDSTNRYARALAADGAEQGTLVVADEQTAGRGRRGRGWISPAGEGIFMTMILRPHAHPSHVAQLSLQTAMARAISRVCEVDARIKWPNDIVCGGKKICGMLLEMNADEQSVHDVVAGIGINVHQKAFEGDVAKTASSLDLLTGKTVCRADVVRAFLEEYEVVDELAKQGSEALMNVYRQHSATLGQRVQVISATGSFTGTAKAVTDSGSLIVTADDDGQDREVLAADVSVRGLMGYA